jgi:Putative restriction endonuclease
MQRTLAHLDDPVQIPRTAGDLAGFREWACSDDFPENGRIDLLDGELDVDMSPEELAVHGLVKAEVATVLQLLVARRNLGSVSRFRLRSREVRPGHWSYRLEKKTGRP